MKTNVRRTPQHVTHEGAPAKRITPTQQLERTVSACLLWEDSFYESGASIADRIREGVHAVSPEAAAEIALRARSVLNLRHAPLLVARELARHPTKPGKIVGDTIAAVIQRADELAEFLALYWKEGRCALSAQTKRGLARAFQKFDAYHLAKYNRAGAVTLRDVLFLTHPKPKDAAQEATWKALVDGTLSSPDTWEVGLSGGADKCATFTRLLTEGKLGYLALLRNLRGMDAAGVDRDLILNAVLARKGARRVLPFRYVAAAYAAPWAEPALDQALQASFAEMPRLVGRTAVLVDVSGSMRSPLSTKSDMARWQAAGALAAILTGICASVRVFTFSERLVEVAPRPSIALIDTIQRSQANHGTYLGAALNTLPDEFDRVIVITDEQSHDAVPGPRGVGYLINVAAYRNGVGYGAWNHVDGWSEGVVRWILERDSTSA